MRKELNVTGRTRRCLNLGSYNYLGFAAADEYCTPRVLDTLADWGMSTCSARTEGGAWDGGRSLIGFCLVCRQVEVVGCGIGQGGFGQHMCMSVWGSDWQARLCAGQCTVWAACGKSFYCPAADSLQLGNSVTTPLAGSAVCAKWNVRCCAEVNVLY